MSRLWVLPLVLFLGCETFAPPTADMVLLDGRVFTGDPQSPWVEGIAIRGETIQAVGTTEEMRRYRGDGTRIVNLEGRLVIPGINDAHVHAPWGSGKEQLEIPGDADAATLMESVRAAVIARPLGTWITGPFPLGLLDGGLTREALDAVAPSHPVRLSTLGGHAALLNTQALRAWNIPEGASDPPGGWYGRAGGRLDGWLYEHALWAPQQIEAEAMSDDQIQAAIASFAREAASYGITSVQTMPLIGAERVARLAEGVEPAIRWRVMDFRMGRVATHPAQTRMPVKYILDGTPMERGAAFPESYSDREGWRGRLNYDPREIDLIFAHAALGERQLLVHASGTSAIRASLDAMRKAASTGWPARRVRLEHADGLSDDLVDDAAALGVVVVQNPSHLMLPQIMTSRFGAGRVGQFSKVRSLIDAGIPFALGSDGPLNPHLNIMFAAMHPANPAEALSVEQAVRAYTRGSAFAELEESRKGTIAPGMLADLAVLSRNIFLAPLPEIPATRSVMTIVGGRVVWEGSEGPETR